MLLMGGGEYNGTKRSTEFVKSLPRGISNHPSLTLQYPTYHACAIQLGEDIVLTGLNDDIHNKEEVKVVKYKINGQQEDFPDLNDKRTKHGCSSFTGKNANKVI